MTSPAASRMEGWLLALARLRRPLAYALFTAAGLLFVAGVLLGSKEAERSPTGYAIDWDYWPEAAGAIMLALVLLGAGSWLALAPAQHVDLTGMRVLILATGGLCGLVIALGTVGRAIRWWNVIFSGGIEAWQGDQGWRLWACIFAELAGLAIMFASLLLARAEERSQPLLRRLLHGYNATLSGLLLLAILVVGNILVFVYFPASYTWTQTRGITELASKSKNILRGLKKDVSVYILMAQGSRIYLPVRTLLDNCQAVSGKVKVKTISPDVGKEEMKRLIERFPSLVASEAIIGGRRVTVPARGILLVYGSEENARQSSVAFIPESKLYGTRRPPRPGPDDPKQTLVFKGEDVILTELAFLTEERQKPRIYFTQENDEPALALMSDFRAELERNMFSVAGLRLRKPAAGIKTDEQTTVATEIPGDAQVVVVVNPVKPFSKEALAALERYMKRGGRMLALIDFDARNPRLPAVPVSGLEKLLAAHDVAVDPSFLLRDISGRGGDPRSVFAVPVDDSANPIVLAMPKKMPLVLPVARPINNLRRSKNYRVEPILRVAIDEDSVWKEQDMRALLNPLPAVSGKRLVKPLDGSPSVAVAVTDARDGKPRMIVCGDMYIALDLRFRQNPRYYDFLENCLNWLRERGERLGIKALESNRFALDFESLNEARMRFLPMFLLAITILGLGAGIWLARRR